MKKSVGITILAAVVLVAASVGWYSWKAAESRAPSGIYNTSGEALEQYIKRHTYSYALHDVKGPVAGYRNGHGLGNYQMTAACVCKWVDGNDTSGTVFVYLDKSEKGWQVVSVGSGP